MSQPRGDSISDPALFREDLLEPPTDHRKRRWLFWTLAFALAITLVWFPYQWVRPSPPIRVSPQTTVLTSPLRPDGLPDYRAARMARYGQGTSTADNAAIPFWRAMGRGDWQPAEWQALQRELGASLAGPAANLGQLQERLKEPLTEWLQQQFPQQPFPGADESLMWEAIGELYGGPWAAADCPPAAEAVAECEQAYALLAEAASRSQYYSPCQADLMRIGETPLPNDVQPLREMTRMLSMRAELRMGEGDLAAAWSDLQTGLQILETKPSDSWIDLLVNVACEGVLRYHTTRLLAHPDLTPETALDIHQTLAGMTPTGDQFRQCLPGERLFCIEQIHKLRDDHSVLESNWLPDESKLPWLLSGSIDWNVLLERQNQLHDELAAAAALPDGASQRQAMQALDERIAAESVDSTQLSKRFLLSFISPGQRAHYVSDTLQSTFAPAASALFQAASRNAQERALLTAAAIVAATRARTGTCPASLDDAGFDTLPIDPVNGQPIQYHRMNDRSFTVYTLGDNGIDDLGANALLWTAQYGARDDHHSRSLLAEMLELSEEQAAAMSTRELIEQAQAARYSISRDADDHAVRITWPRESLTERLAAYIEVQQAQQQAWELETEDGETEASDAAEE